MSKLSKNQLKDLANLSDSEIDFSDIKELKTLKGFKKLYPNHKGREQISNQQIFAALDEELHKVSPQKKPVTINLDERVIDFFKKHSKKYQTKINDILVAFVNNYQAKH